MHSCMRGSRRGKERVLKKARERGDPLAAAQETRSSWKRHMTEVKNERERETDRQNATLSSLIFIFILFIYLSILFLNKNSFLMILIF